MKTYLSQMLREKDKEFIKDLNAKWERYENLPKFIRWMFKPKIPKPPFNLGAKIMFKLDVPIFGFQKGKIYTAYNLELSRNKDKWFVRTVEMPSSTYANDFEWV